MKRRPKAKKEPGIIGRIVEVCLEQARRRRELRRLSRESWSIDFLSYLLVKSARLTGEGVTLVITNRDGVSIRLDCRQAAYNSANVTDDILSRLDDDAAVEEFINLHGRK